jgi:Domain of unknown function (DUF4326)
MKIKSRGIFFNMKKDGTRVVHCQKEKYDVYIGRPSIWGNPFKIGPNADRKHVVLDYEMWLLGEGHKNFKQEERKMILERLPQLRGKVLGCWCKPLECHGDVLAKLADEEWKRKRNAPG